MSEHAAVMTAIANLADRLDDITALLEGDLTQLRRDLDDVMEAVTGTNIASIEPQATLALPVTAAKPKCDNYSVWPQFRDYPNKLVAQSIARRIASMAIIGGYDERLLAQNWTQMNGVPLATETQVAEIVEHWDSDFRDLVRLAQHLYEPGGWSAAVVGMFLAMLFHHPGSKLHEDGFRRAVRGLAMPANGSKTTKDHVKSDFARAMFLFQLDDATVLKSLRLWAGHCGWAHPSVRESYDE